MTTKTAKKLLVGILALSCGAVLASCDAVKVLPKNYEDAILNNADGKKTDVYQNILGILYDATATGKTDDTLNALLKVITEDQFGTYKALKAAASGTAEEKTAFINEHKATFIKDNDATIVEQSGIAGYSVDQLRIDRLDDFYKDLKERVNEVFYNEIKSNSYSDDTKKFYEERLAMAHYAEMYDVDITKTDWFEGYLTPEFDKKDVSAFIHDDGRYDDYIERKIIPTIYKEKLVEQYLYNSSYNKLGSAYARKVNMIKITRDDKFKNFANNLMSKYVDTYILDIGATADFEMLANCWRGFHGIDEDGLVEELTTGAGSEVELLVDAGATVDTIDPTDAKYNLEETLGTAEFSYYKESQLGQLIDEYKKIDETNRFPSSEADDALNKFTKGEGTTTYPKEYGFKLKIADLALTDYTTDGWYVKNGGLTELPDTIRTRLFNINVSNEVDTIAEEDATHKYDAGNYVRHINGQYYLTPEKAERAEVDPRNFLLYNDGSFYIVQVNEAVSTSKIKVDGKKNYQTIRPNESPIFTERVVREIAKVLGTKESYVNDAYESYIEKYCVMFHDSEVYEYFKEKYPDLFD